MPERKIGTREEWQAARDELAKLEAEQAERNEEITSKRRDLPWVPVEKEYEFDTEDGTKTLAELFDGRSQLLAYNIMFGPDYTLGACPGCTSLGDGLDGSLVHLNHRDVTLLCFSRAPIERLTAYKRRMGWQFPYVSTYNTDFAFDFGLAMTKEQAHQIPEVKGMIDDPPDWLQEWSAQIGAELEDGLREGPSWIAFARENGTVYHTYRRDGARPVRRAVLQLPARANAEDATRRAPHLAEGRVPGLTPAAATPHDLHALTRRGLREQLAHLFVGCLREVLVPEADGDEGLRRDHADDLVDFRAELVTDSLRGDGHRHHDLFGMALADGERGGMHRSAGREAVVDEDHRASVDVDRRAAAAIQALAPFELASPDGRGAGNVFVRESELGNHAGVENTGAAVRDRTHRELLVTRYAQFANEKDVERGLEAASELEANGHAAARQREHDDIVTAGVFLQLVGEQTARIETVPKAHLGHHPARAKPRKTRTCSIQSGIASQRRIS